MFGSENTGPRTPPKGYDFGVSPDLRTADPGSAGCRGAGLECPVSLTDPAVRGLARLLPGLRLCPVREGGAGDSGSYSGLDPARHPAAVRAVLEPPSQTEPAREAPPHVVGCVCVSLPRSFFPIHCWIFNPVQIQ